MLTQRMDKQLSTIEAEIGKAESPGGMQALVRRAQTGEQAAIQELYLSHHEQIYRFIWSRVHDPAQASDLTGEVFLRMVAGLRRYQERGQPFRAWLYEIARNLVVDEFRRNRKRIDTPLESLRETASASASPEEQVEKSLALEQVHMALNRIAAEQREVVELRFLAGLSLQEAAQVVGKTVLAVKGLQHRGLEQLRENLKELQVRHE
jgi:RNA polymerase sigma-70 factor (ECF subfamily)